MRKILGCICSKGTRANDNEDSSHDKDTDLPKSSKNQSLKSGGNGRRAILGLIPNDTVSSEEAEKKDEFERKSSKSVFSRRSAMDGGGSNGGSLQPKMIRVASISNGEQGAQVIAGWPSWLAKVAGEAINGWIPRKADSFEKLEKIGQGTYSSVYKARDLESNQIVALKKVRFTNMDPESVRFMAREIIILRRLDHPNIMKLEGLITSKASGSLYLVFEYMDHDLSGLSSTPGITFSEAQIKCYMKQLLHGLEYCHAQGVLHRDIKGSNLLLDHNNNLKIGDFGLANFLGGQLTSRVVTLWYRPPELLLGATDYGDSVDLWSTGCILAELFNGKPIMPGRTEVEQLHKIFKLCGSPSEEYWKRLKLPHTTSFKPQQPYKRCVAETFKDIPSSALSLLELLLAVEPDARGTASSALQSDFFTTKPFPSDASTLPRYQPRKEYDVKFRDKEARLKKGQNGSKQASRECRAAPIPDANANNRRELECYGGKNVRENLLVVENSSNSNEDGFLDGSSHSKALRTQRSFVRRGAAQLSRFSNSVAARDDGSRFGSVRDTIPDSSYGKRYGDRSSEKPKPAINEERHSHGKAGPMRYSGPLLPARGNLDEMLKEHERQIQLAVRRARVDKTKRDNSAQREGLLMAANGR